MAKERSPNRDKAFELWKNSNGTLKLKDIAEQLGVSDIQIRKWKNQDKWDNQLKGTLPKSNSNVTKKSATSKGNGNVRVPKATKEPVREVDPEDVIDEVNGLRPKERLFVKYYLVNFNATQAAIKSGYSSKTAKEIGYELLTKPHIKEAIKKYNEELTFEIGMNVQRTIMEYMRIAFSDITEFVEFGQKDEPVIGDDGPIMDPQTGEPMTYKRSYVAFKESEVVDGTIISEVKQGKDGVGIKLHDKMKALEVLTKYHDLLPDHHKRMVDAEKLKLDRERFEFEKVKAAGEGDLDEELIDDWVGAVLGDDDGDDAENGDEEGDT